MRVSTSRRGNRPGVVDWRTLGTPKGLACTENGVLSAAADQTGKVSGTSAEARARRRGLVLALVLVVVVVMLIFTAVTVEATAAERADWAPLTGSHSMSCTWGDELEDHCTLTKPSGRVIDPYHPYPAIDISAEEGTTVHAAGNGVVSGTGFHSAFGHWATIYHKDDDRTSLYAHLSSSSPLAKGDSVHRGQPIGSVGQTGQTTGPHLHYVEAAGRRNGPFSGSAAVEPGPMKTLQDGEQVAYPDAFEGATSWPEVNIESGANPYTLQNEGYPSSSEVSTALIIDSSGSMDSNDSDDRRLDGAKSYLAGSLPSDEVGVVDFDNNAQILSEVVEVGSHRQGLSDAIAQIDSSGGTDLGAGLQAGCDVLSGAGNPTRGAVFFTDGQGSYSGQAQCFADQGWPVYVFGLGSNVDSTVLQDIADETGGEYTHLSDATDLICEFQQVRAKIAGQPGQSCDLSGTIAQDQVVEFLEEVAIGLQQFTFSIWWPGSDIQMTVTSPSGRTITRDSTGSDLVIEHGSTFETFTISDPEPGDWNVALFGADVPDGGEPYGFSTLPIEGDVGVEADLKLSSLHPSSPPSEQLIGDSAEVNVEAVIANEGPSSPMDVTTTWSTDTDDGISFEPTNAEDDTDGLTTADLETLTRTFTVRCESPGKHEVRLTARIDPASPDDRDPNATNNQETVSFVVDCVVPITINVKPGEEPNSVNTKKRGNIPVAVLTTDEGQFDTPVAFDATTVEISTIRAGTREAIDAGRGATPAHDGHEEDSWEPNNETKDGDTDLVVHFEPPSATELGRGDDELCVRGEYVDSPGSRFSFVGCDQVRVVR